MPAEGPSDSVFDAPALTELTDDVDAFGHHDYAAAIAEVLVEAGTPFTLGLYGPWGVGKTLILTEARKIIGERCAYVVFDAWRYDGDALRRHFLRDIARQLDEGDRLEDWYDRDEELKDLDVARSEPTTGKIKFSGKQLLSGGIGLAIIGLLALFLWLAGDFHKALTGLVAGAGVVALAIAVLSPFANAIELTEVTEIRERLVDAELFTAGPATSDSSSTTPTASRRPPRCPTRSSCSSHNSPSCSTRTTPTSRPLAAPIRD